MCAFAPPAGRTKGPAREFSMPTFREDTTPDDKPDHFAGPQAAAIAEAEQEAGLETARDGQQPLCLIPAHHQRNLLGLAEVIDLGGKVQSPQRHAEQEPQPGHDAVAVAADARARLGQVKLKAADVVECGRVRGTLEKRSKPLAAADMASLRARAELARIHVLDHALAQRSDGWCVHRKLLSEMRLTPRSSRQAAPPATDDLSSRNRARGEPHRAARYRAAI
jgi:hypothetical protein